MDNVTKRDNLRKAFGTSPIVRIQGYFYVDDGVCVNGVPRFDFTCQLLCARWDDPESFSEFPEIRDNYEWGFL